MSRLRLILVLLTALLLGWSPTAATATVPTPRPEITELGPAIIGGQTSPDVANGYGPHGEPQVYFFFNGSQRIASQFTVLDVRTGKVVFHQRVPYGSSSWGVDFSEADGTVYFATADTGHLYRYDPSNPGIENLGVPAPGLGIWSLNVGPTGTVWLGTQPAGTLVAYDPSTRSTRDYGQVLPGRDYVMTAAEADGTVYVGLKAPAALVAVDVASGARTQLPLPGGHENSASIKDVFVRGNFVLAAAERDGKDGLHYFDRRPGAFVHYDPDYRGREISPLASDGSVYYRSVYGQASGAARAVRINLETRSIRRVLPWAPNVVSNVLDLVDLAGAGVRNDLLTCGYQGRCYTYNVVTGATTYTDVVPQIEPTGARLIRTAVGPDGNVYFSGYLSPAGMGQWNPTTATMSLLRGSGQLEGIGVWGNDLLLGRYPKAGLAAWDTSTPWTAPAFTYPDPLLHQDRPMDFAGLEDHVVTATTPAAQTYGGALVEWWPQTGQTITHTDFGEQTPVSIVERDGLIWGGTSRYGGYGVPASEGSAQLFAWDPTTGNVVYRTVVVEGAMSVNGLAVDPVDGTLWMLVRGTVVHFDPASRQVLSRTQVYADEWTGSLYQDEFDLKFDSEGWLFGLAEGHLFYFDTQVLKAFTLVQEASGFDVARHDHLYFTVDTIAYRASIPPTLRAYVRSAR